MPVFTVMLPIETKSALAFTVSVPETVEVFSEMALASVKLTAAPNTATVLKLLPAFVAEIFPTLDESCIAEGAVTTPV